MPTKSKSKKKPGLLSRFASLFGGRSGRSSIDNGNTTSFFRGANRFQTGDVHVHMGDNLKSIDGWELLLQNVAPNALHNSSARYDAPKCDEDTRVEVIREIMECLEDRKNPRRLLCMTGAAGSGKSCLQQTTAEKCVEDDILAASFFLSAEDPTRNTVDNVIPTIAYQLGRTSTTLKWLIKAAIEKDPLIFFQSLVAQTTALIVAPVERMRDKGRSLPYVILIDGLDECRGEDLDGYRSEDRQAELLTAVRCLVADHLPFRIFIASRPQWAIRTALEPGGHLREMAYHIQLSDNYDASADMRRYLQRRFEDIGLRINDPNWFSVRDVETLVQAGSGQFIYVATVYKYVSQRRASPAARLNVILTWTPRAGQVTKPFETLDNLYYNILLAAKNTYEAVDTHHGRDFLLLFRALYKGSANGFNLGPIHEEEHPLHFNRVVRVQRPVDYLCALLCLEDRAEEALLLDLRSLVALEADGELHLYHKSFSDFLKEPSRAKDLFVPKSRFYDHLARCFMQRIIEFPLDINSLPSEWDDLPFPKSYRNSLLDVIDHLPFSLRASTIDDEVASFTHVGGWQKIDDIWPLVYPQSECWPQVWLEAWTGAVRDVADRLKAQNPDAAAIINAFVEKWESHESGLDPVSLSFDSHSTRSDDIRECPDSRAAFIEDDTRWWWSQGKRSAAEAEAWGSRDCGPAIMPGSSGRVPFRCSPPPLRRIPKMPRKENPGPISAQAQQDLVSEGIENYELPKSVVMKIALSEKARLTKETVLSLVKASTVWIPWYIASLLFFGREAELGYIAATAHDVAVSKQHKSIAATDVLKPLEMLDFADLVGSLSDEMKIFKDQRKTTSGKKSGGASSKGFSISIPPSAGGSGSIRLPANNSNSASAAPITLKVKSKSSTASINTPTDTGRQGASDSERNTPNSKDAEMADTHGALVLGCIGGLFVFFKFG